MSNSPSRIILEGDAFFVLQKYFNLIEDKKIEINPESTQSLSLLDCVDYYVFFDPSKEIIENIKCNNFIICFMDKNVDLRLDYIKKIKKDATFITFDPIPTTDFHSLREIFPAFKTPNHLLPFKKVNLKYKGTKQNYEWFDLCIIADLYNFEDTRIYSILHSSYFDIWNFTDGLWTGNINCLSQIKNINDSNFEDYFNRIRETSKDYLELLQTGANNLSQHKKLLPQSSIINDFRFIKIKEKLNKLKPCTEIDCVALLDNCLKNVRQGSNPKLELINLFIRFKQNVL
jgi:hypothetical protein